MKRWAIIVTLAYALLWLVLAYPVVWLTMRFEWGWPLDDGDRFGLFPQELFSEPLFWGIFVTFVICQIVLLLVPVTVNGERPRARRSILWPATAIAFLLANLVFWGAASLSLLGLDFDVVFAPVDFLAESMQQAVEQGAAIRLSGSTSPISAGWYGLAAILMVISAVWLLWGGLFYRFYRTAEAEGWTRRWLKNLFRGSVIELLVALPTHLILRSRNDCCAPMVSFMGIVTGLSIMVLCFGPGVMFLYLDRAKRLKPKDSKPERPVDGTPTQP